MRRVATVHRMWVTVQCIPRRRPEEVTLWVAGKGPSYDESSSGYAGGDFWFMKDEESHCSWRQTICVAAAKELLPLPRDFYLQEVADCEECTVVIIEGNVDHDRVRQALRHILREDVPNEQKENQDVASGGHVDHGV